jgi:alpha-mannosidase
MDGMRIRTLLAIGICQMMIGIGAAAGLAAPNPSTRPTLYVVGYSHLDTEWRWSYPQVIREFLPNTLRNNFSLFEKYPGYIFNWTGANRYRLMKEYYPEDYARLKAYVAAGRWYPNGSALEEGDVDIPSGESVVRQILYANDFFRREFGQAPADFMLPDCFGFPASLPTILAHCGIAGFSTQKLTWGSAVGIPFNVGVWVGTDGRSVMAALNPGSYGSGIGSDLSSDPVWIRRLDGDGRASGVYVDYRYFGTGDRGGSPDEKSVAQLEQSLTGTGPLRIISARADQMFKDLTPEQISRLPHYRGDLLLTWHSAGSASSQAQMKHWNRENELLGDETERASVAADWLGALSYEHDRITDAWWRFLPGQFHDLMAGTALPMAYHFAWNDQVLAINEFTGVLGEAIGGVIRAMDTRGQGTPIVVYNPLSVEREDVAEATINFSAAPPDSAAVFGPDGSQVPSQIQGRDGNKLTILFLARVPSVGFAVYDVRPGAASNTATDVAASASQLENARYRVRLDENGDVASIYDKSNQREILSSPARLAFMHERPSLYPAWNMDWEDQQKPPYAYVDGPAKVTVVENGPVRAALRVEREAQGSRFVQTISLAAGSAGDRIEFQNHIEWQSTGCALKAVFPLTVSNPMATYNWEPGTIMRGNNDPKKYEVPAHQWFDLTHTDGSYGLSVLTRDKYGSDKPDDSTLRLTLLYTPGVHHQYQDQSTQDWGEHDFVYGISGHAGDWAAGDTPWQAARLNQTLVAFQAPAHPGPLGKSWSLLRVSDRNVKVEALKKAEHGGEVIVRLGEVDGKPARAARLMFASPIVSAREVDGQEQPLGPANVENGALVLDMDPYQLRAFALTLAAPAERLEAPTSAPVDLPYNVNAENDFNGNGEALAGEKVPAIVDCDGVSFKFGPMASGQKNAVACSGQVLTIPTGSGRRLYLLAASSDGDVRADFGIGVRTIQAWDGSIGQWDTRLWKGDVPQLTYDWNNPLLGLVPGYIKPDTVGWYADHKRSRDGSKNPYAFTYLFKYEFDLPDGVQTFRLPDDDRIKVMAASIADDPNADSAPAQSLYDRLDHKVAGSVTIVPAGGRFDSIQRVEIIPPLYNWGDIRYTTDGTDPSPSSPRYEGRLNIAHPAILKAASFSPDGQSGDVAKAVFDIDNKTPPQIESIRLERSGLRVIFNEPLEKSMAQNVANYALNPPVAIKSAKLSDGGDEVTLELAGIMDDVVQYALSISNIRDLSGNISAAGTEYFVEPIGPVIRVGGVHDFDGKGDGIEQGEELINDPSSPHPHLPIEADASWTINFFALADQKPVPMMILAGFGNASDTTGTQRYFVEGRGGVGFWGSNIDLTTGIPLDIGKWQMFTATFDGKTLRMYRNARFIKSGDVEFANAAPIARLAPPGPWKDAHRFVGKLAGFAIWNRELDPGSIERMMKQIPQAQR